MAQNNHPRQRQASRLRRRPSRRPPYDRILIVCEGAKTGPGYLEDIRKAFRIATAYLRILPSGMGPQPRRVVDFAEHLFLQTREFDAIYVVFDRDEHAIYQEALIRAAQLNEALSNDAKQKVPSRRSSAPLAFNSGCFCTSPTRKPSVIALSRCGD